MDGLRGVQHRRANAVKTKQLLTLRKFPIIEVRVKKPQLSIENKDIAMTAYGFRMLRSLRSAAKSADFEVFVFNVNLAVQVDEGQARLDKPWKFFQHLDVDTHSDVCSMITKNALFPKNFVVTAEAAEDKF